MADLAGLEQRFQAEAATNLLLSHWVCWYKACSQTRCCKHTFEVKSWTWSFIRQVHNMESKNNKNWHIVFIRARWLLEPHVGNFRLLKEKFRYSYWSFQVHLFTCIWANLSFRCSKAFYMESILHASNIRFSRVVSKCMIVYLLSQLLLPVKVKHIYSNSWPPEVAFCVWESTLKTRSYLWT